MRSLFLTVVGVLAVTSCQRSPGGRSEPTVTPRETDLLWASPELTGLVVGQALPTCDSRGARALEAARRYYEREEYVAALSCAAQATAQTPEDPQAHSERGAALAALGRTDEATLAYARALALDPDQLDALLGAGHLFGVTLPSSRERDELAALYAERGFVLAQRRQHRRLLGDFALLSAMVFNDLGQAEDALLRAGQAMRLSPQSHEAAYERAVALFELCRFAEAKKAFASLVDAGAHAAGANHHLGLLLEREGKWKLAEQHFERSRILAPKEFVEPHRITEEAFRAEVSKAVAALPSDMRRDLEGIPVTAEELPKDDDLLGDTPSLSPTILGLFRGPSLAEPCSAQAPYPCRAIALYRRNLARAAQTRAQFVQQVRVTLLHEVGHLRGEDDFELAARGLE
ncbi:MAG: metallopeptidase family protein [Myxococcaceae bacterium]